MSSSVLESEMLQVRDCVLCTSRAVKIIMGQSDAILSVFFFSLIHAPSARYLCCSCPSACIGSAPAGRIFMKCVKIVEIRRQTRNLVAIGQDIGHFAPKM